MTRRARILVVVVGMVTGACANDAGLGNVVSGYWANQDVHLSATTHGATFDEACLHAAFAPLTLGHNGTVAAHSDTLIESGNLFHLDTDTLSLSGRIVGNQITLTVYVIRVQPPISDPIQITLTAGGSHDKPVCTE